MNEKNRLKRYYAKEQISSLEGLRKRLVGSKTNDCELEIIISLDKYDPPHRIEYNYQRINGFLKSALKNYVINLYGFDLFLFEEVTVLSDAWISINDKKVGGEIYIQTDRLINYSWHFNHFEEEDLKSIPIEEISSILWLFLGFLASFYPLVNYKDRIKIEICTKGWEDHVFYRDNINYEVFRSNTAIHTLERIYSIERLQSKEERRAITQSIINEFVLKCFKITNYFIPDFLK